MVCTYVCTYVYLYTFTPVMCISRQSIGTLEERIRENTMTIRRLQDAKSDRLKGFGHWMPQIIQAINQCREFRRKPVGPLG